MKRRLLLLIAVVIVGLAACNASSLADRPDGPLRLVAHRGVHQTFSAVGVDNDTCTAARSNPITHGYIENTIPSIQAAFDAGAEMVELDVHASADGYLVVFHDHDLACRTDGTGRPEDQSLAVLRDLDLGYGYTADGGESYPLRGTGVGLLKTLPEIYEAFPDRRFMVHIKTNDPADGERVVEVLRTLPNRTQQVVYGGAKPVDVVRQTLPDVPTWETSRVKRCLERYVATGWTGMVPQDCHNTWVVVPQSHTRLIWGFPRRFEQRMAEVGSEVVLAGPIVDGNSTGVDEATDQDAVRSDFGGWVWTNRIETWDTDSQRFSG